MKKKGLVLTVVAVCLVGILLIQDRPVGVAQRQGHIGTIDLEAIWNHNILPGLEEPLIQETARLQAELDIAVEGKTEAEKQETFDAFQTKLYALQQEIVDGLLDDVRRVIAEVAEEQGISVVLDANSVMYGGIDVTHAVLERLGH